MNARTRENDAGFSQKSISSTMLSTVSTTAAFNTFRERVATEEFLKFKVSLFIVAFLITFLHSHPCALDLLCFEGSICSNLNVLDFAGFLSFEERRT